MFNILLKILSKIATISHKPDPFVQHLNGQVSGRQITLKCEPFENVTTFHPKNSTLLRYFKISNIFIHYLQAVNSEIKTLDDLVNVSQRTTGGWRLVDDIDWENIPMGLCPGNFIG